MTDDVSPKKQVTTKMSDNIKVVVKVRPLIPREVEDNLSLQWRVVNNTLNQIDQHGKNAGQAFTFDKIYDESTQTCDVYNDIAKPIVEAATAGINGTIFAYGQTSSGKTYTMTGTDSSPGIIPLAVLDLFDIIKRKEDRDFLLRVSYLEIYNETIKDLLNIENDNLKINDTQCSVKDLTEMVTSTPDEVLKYMEKGNANRHIGSTNMNEESSRSHSIFQITIESREHTEGDEECGCVNVSQLNLVDLAGSERAGQTGAMGKRFKEGTHINLSLSSLALCIKQLSEKNKHVNYRDSKLTRILQNSLGGNAKTSIICAVTPVALEETISTLQFACRAKAIKNKPEVNAVATDATMIQKLTKQLARLLSQLEEKKYVEKDNQMLSMKIKNLQSQILNGFGERRGGDVSYANRRKTWCAPRRATISALCPIAEDAVPPVPRFCTPAQKYYPQSSSLMTDFRPIRPAEDKAPRVSDAAAGHVTPPMRDRKVNFNDEIIELEDSDDDEEGKTCSPYHKCHKTSKTPPCVLRDKAKKAEKSLMDIIELTEREKMYGPDVEELLKKLEDNTRVISTLQEKISALSEKCEVQEAEAKAVAAKLNEKCEERDAEFNALLAKLTQTEVEMNALNTQKIELEKECKDYNKRLTDIEVSYEVQKNKAKSRENELLSLLEEQKTVRNKTIGKPQPNALEFHNFMDLSKDISLVNSDTESSIINPNEDDGSSQINELVSEMQAQITSKNQIIEELERNLATEKEKIDNIEKISKQLEENVASLTEQNNQSNNEIFMLKSTVETLEGAIKSLNENLEFANNEIESYNNLIQKLQTELIDKKDPEENLLETMMSSEDKMLANNENIKNIIYSLQTAMTKRHIELHNLKEKINSKVELFETKLKLCNEQVCILTSEREILREQISKDCVFIKEITEQNQDLLKSKQILINENEALNYRIEELKILENSEKEYRELYEKLLEDNSSNSIIKLQKENTDILTKLNNTRQLLEVESEKYISLEEKLRESHLTLQKRHDETAVLHSRLREIEVSEKEHRELYEKLNQCQAVMLTELDDVRQYLKIATQQLKETDEERRKSLKQYEDEVVSLQLQIKSLENSEKDWSALYSQLKQEHEQTITQLKESQQSLQSKIKECIALDEKIAESSQQHQREHVTLQPQLTEIKKSENLNIERYEELEQKQKKIIEELNVAHESMEEKRKECNSLEAKLAESLASIQKYQNEMAALQSESVKSKQDRELNEELQQERAIILTELNNTRHAMQEHIDKKHSLEVKLIKSLNENKNLITLMSDSETELKSRIKDLNEELQDIVKKESDVQKQIKPVNDDSDTLQIIAKANEQLKEMQKDLQQKDNNLEELKETLENIHNKIQSITSCFAIENSLLEDLNQSDINIQNHEYILQGLDTIANHMNILKDKISEGFFDEHNQLDIALNEAKTQIRDLTTQNLDLTDKVSKLQDQIKMSCIQLNKLQEHNESLNDSIEEANKLIVTLQNDLKTKVKAQEVLEKNIELWKIENSSLSSTSKEQLSDLSIQKDRWEDQTERENVDYMSSENNFSDVPVANFNKFSDIRKSLLFATVANATNGPQSLISICSKKIIGLLDAQRILTPPSSDSSVQICNSETQTDICNCIKLNVELNSVNEEILRLKSLVDYFKQANKQLIDEQENIRKEVRLLVEPATDLQKKISSHRSNLSTLTATTYAENKLLKSQVKALQHHHMRLLNLCQKDIPAFKQQLRSLLSIMQADPMLFDKGGFKRFSLPDVLDKNCSVVSFKNDSTLDGDLLMLETSVTLANLTDNTLVGHDQTYYDITQTDVDNTGQLANRSHIDIIDSSVLQGQMDVLTDENNKMVMKLEAVEIENRSLKEQVNKLSQLCNQQTDCKSVVEDATLKDDQAIEDTICENCQDRKNLTVTIDQLTKELTVEKAQKSDLNDKIKELTLEIPSTEALARKINNLEKDIGSKTSEISRLTNVLSNKNRDLKQLQDENDTLSTQVMESISETDDLRKELDLLKNEHSDLINKFNTELKVSRTPAQGSNVTCSQCYAKDEVILALRNKRLSGTESILNISHQERNSSLRFNKFCTLQNELHASREDCQIITEEVATIKNQLDRSNNMSMSQSMDLDDSMGESNIFTLTKDFEAVHDDTSNKYKVMPNIPEEKYQDVYAVEKADCFNYYLEITGSEKENIRCEHKIIDLMKMLYNNLLAKHANEVQNLSNKLKDFEDVKKEFEMQLNLATIEYSKVWQEVQDRNNSVATVKDRAAKIIEALSNVPELDNAQIIAAFKDKVLHEIDNEFCLNTSKIFDSIIFKVGNKHELTVGAIKEQYSNLQERMEKVMTDFSNLNENLKQMKAELMEKEKEYNILKAQKDKVHEISNAVTLDIVKKEQELSYTIKKACQTLIENNLIRPEDVGPLLPLSKNVETLFERLIIQFKEKEKLINSAKDQERDSLILEVNKSKTIIEEKDYELSILKSKTDQISELPKMYEAKVNENIETIKLLEQEIDGLKKVISEKETTIKQTHHNLETQICNNSKINELLETIQILKRQNSDLKTANETINKEKESVSMELQKAGETIKSNEDGLNKMSAEIASLSQSLQEKITVIRDIKSECNTLLEMNKTLNDNSKQLNAKLLDLRHQYEEKCRELTRLELNIKTHEKTAEIQSKIITGLKKQKEIDVKNLGERDQQLEELTNKYFTLESECAALKESLHTCQQEIENLTTIKTTLETRVSELSGELSGTQKGRPSLEAVNVTTRRRRQSLHDSMRACADDKRDSYDNNNVDALFASRQQADDLFMDVDIDESSSHSPARLSKGRDSLRMDQHSDKDDDSRPSSVLATRRRRQSTHDLQRTVLRRSNSPLESPLAKQLKEELAKSSRNESLETGEKDSELSQVRQELESCQEQLQELREQYRELDEECEICSQYLREREQQCVRLKTEKTALENSLAAYKAKMTLNSDCKKVFADAAVNTDEDWTKLHSLVVDRMSFDAEVEKTKRLTKAMEESRYKNRELRATVAKMEKALEKNAARDSSALARELEATKQELSSCKQELESLQVRFKEVDEECEECAAYLREREKQCAQLKMEKVALEQKLQELQDSGASAQSARKKRQSLHDQNRDPRLELVDTATETTEDLSSHRDESTARSSFDDSSREVKSLKMTLEKLAREKAALEQRLHARSDKPQSPIYVGTGSAIVQNQQFTDVMKENHKLKKINAKLIHLCKKRGIAADRETNDVSEQSLK